MKIPKILATAALAVAGASILTSPAIAGSVSSSLGDLVLGFRATGGTGSGSNLEVDLGASSLFTSPASSTFTLPGLLNADLVNTYGSSWFTRSDLFWGIIGTTGGLSPTLYASNGEATPGTQSTAWVSQAATSQRTPSGVISSVYTTLNGQTSTSSTTAAVIGSGIGGSWTSQELIQAGQSFKFFTPTIDNSLNTIGTQGSALDGTAYTVLDLYKLAPSTGAGNLVGGFGLNSSGNLVFSTNLSQFQAVPEPSTYAMAGIGAALLIFMARRRPASA